MLNWQIFLTGVTGAFAPQVLRWYSQPPSEIVETINDPVQLACYMAVTVLFLGVAGYVTMLWKVRSLKEAFFVGLAVPSIILSAGTDVASITPIREAGAQMIASTVNLVVNTRTEEGTDISGVKIVAINQTSARTYSGGKEGLALPPGRYTVSIEANGYKTERREIMIDQKSVSIDVTMRPKSLRGRILNGITRPFER